MHSIVVCVRALSHHHHPCALLRARRLLSGGAARRHCMQYSCIVLPCAYLPMLYSTIYTNTTAGVYRLSQLYRLIYIYI